MEMQVDLYAVSIGNQWMGFMGWPPHTHPRWYPSDKLTCECLHCKQFADELASKFPNTHVHKIRLTVMR